MTARVQRPSMTTEKPLAPQARGALVVAAALTMLAFYAIAAIWMVLFATVLIVLTIALIGAARVGLGAFVVNMMGPPNQLLRILVRRLWLPAGVEYRIPLRRSDAPKLFELVANLAKRMGVAPPDTVVVEMQLGAWIQLGGFARASGKTTLGIGFDLLAGLSKGELEAVIAHELAHARLVQRGFSRWLNKGMARLVGVAQEMNDFRDTRAAANEPSDLAKWSVAVFDALTIRAARLVATYSRQDEFEADRTAAETVGAGGLRSSLIKLEKLGDAVGRLPWSERVARLQGSNFTTWLVAELARLIQVGSDEPVRHAADPYSTHPTLRSRIAALFEAEEREAPGGGAAVELLIGPNTVAKKLNAEIERVLWKQEQKNTKDLARDTRKLVKRESSSWLELLGVIVVVFGVIMGVIVANGTPFWDGVGVAVVSLVAGVGLYRLGTYRDKQQLPIPAYGTLTNAKKFESNEALGAAEDALTARLQDEAASKGGNSKQTAFLVSAAYESLRRREYLDAHVAARLALQLKPKSVEASLAYAIAAAALGGAEQMSAAMTTVKTEAGFTSPSTNWGGAWALVMLGDWNSAEGLLQRLHDADPQNATFAGLLALAQLHRGKLQSAIRNARKARALDPKNAECTQLLIHTLLAAGQAREAGEWAASIKDASRTDADAAFLQVRVKLMLDDLAGAQEWAAVLRALDTEGEWLIALGGAFASARLDEPAGAFYADAVATPYTPQANVGLAMLAGLGGDRAKARQHLLAALSMEKKKLAAGYTPTMLFHEVLGRLNALDERRVACKAWIAAFPSESPFTLSGLSVLVAAVDENKAREHLCEVCNAMQTGEATFDVSSVVWSVAPEDQQPIRPIQPGVQCLIS